MASNNHQSTTSNEHSNNWLSQWPSNLSLANCERCDWIFLLPSDAPSRCPHCGQPELVRLDAETDKPVYTQPPELVVPFSVDLARVKQSVTQFAKGIGFAPADMTAKRLNGRLQKLYLPLWLVDTAVNARWEAEMGFNYEVISHREQYKDDKWVTTEYKGSKIRWESRIGTLNRQYDNVRAPALEEQQAIEQHLGPMVEREERPYQPDALADAFICLPNRPPEDAWEDVQLTIRKIATKECQRAGKAAHQRNFRWSADYHNKHWTQLLYPIYVTHYLDDDDNANMIFIHGQTGKLIGKRRASPKKAKKISVGFGIVTAVSFAISLLLFLGGIWMPTLSPIGATLLNIAFWLGTLAFVPLVAVWLIDRFYSSENQAVEDSLLL